MKIIQSTHNLRRVEEGGGVVEPARTPQVAEQLPAADVGEQHVKEALVLGAPAQVHQERVIYFLKMVRGILVLMLLIPESCIIYQEMKD